MQNAQAAPNEEVLEGEVVSPEHSQEIVRPEQVLEHGVTLFGTNDPTEVIQRAAKVATALKDILHKQRLTTRIGSNDHVQVEGWQTLGSMLGVFPVPSSEVEEIAWPDIVPTKLQRAKDDGLSFGFKASYNAQTLTGAVVGGGEADCRRTESKWMTRDDHALKSMAQTRAQSKALKAPMGFIVTMAGYEATPAEEMDSVTYSGYDAPYGPPMNPHDNEKLARAMTFLINDAQTVMAVKHVIEEESGGYLPRIVFRTLVHTAKAARDGIEINKQVKEEAHDGS
jgi:hypothetical protein